MKIEKNNIKLRFFRITPYRNTAGGKKVIDAKNNLGPL